MVAFAYREPLGLVSHFDETRGAAVRRAREIDLAFQNKVIPVGDFLATWAVQGAIHHLDLTVELPNVGSPASSALALVRATLDGLVDTPIRTGWDDKRYALKCTGRLPLTEEEKTAR